MLPKTLFARGVGPVALALIGLAGLAALVVTAVWLASAPVPRAPTIPTASQPASIPLPAARPEIDADPNQSRVEQPSPQSQPPDGDEWIETPQPAVAALPAPDTAATAPRAAPRADSQLVREAVAPPASRPSAPDRSVEIRRAAVERFGGNAGTETAVDAGLRWLAVHQDPVGLWRRNGFAARCPPEDRCGGQVLTRRDAALDEGLTGLALLAFLGIGATHQEGPYQPTVAAAAEALLRAQRPHGGFSPTDEMAGYNDSLALFALAELYAQSRDERLREPVQRGAARLAATQQPLGGWDYLPDPGSGRNDTSITAWCVQALQACMAAGVDAPRSTLIQSALHLARATHSDGRVWYADHGNGFLLDRQTLRPVYRYGPAMTAAGLTCGVLLGWSSESPVVRRQHALLLAELPSAARLQGGDPTQLHDYYYWYYGTVAMFQAGGADWDRWNASLRDALLPLQERARPGAAKPPHALGSFPPFGHGWGKWGRMGGRVYSTAISVLTLETYYRHTPAYLENPVSPAAAEWRTFLRGADPRQQRTAVEALAGMRLEIGEPALLDLLETGDPTASLQAAIALAELGSPRGAARLAAAIASNETGDRLRMERAVRRCEEILAAPASKGRVRYVDAARGLCTLNLSPAFAGMRVEVIRDGAAVAELRVLRRISGAGVVVAEWLPPRASGAVVADDVAAGR